MRSEPRAFLVVDMCVLSQAYIRSQLEPTVPENAVKNLKRWRYLEGTFRPLHADPQKRRKPVLVTPSNIRRGNTRGTRSNAKNRGNDFLLSCSRRISELFKAPLSSVSSEQFQAQRFSNCMIILCTALPRSRDQEIPLATFPLRYGLRYPHEQLRRKVAFCS